MSLCVTLTLSPFIFLRSSFSFRNFLTSLLRIPGFFVFEITKYRLKYGTLEEGEQPFCEIFGETCRAYFET